MGRAVYTSQSRARAARLSNILKESRRRDLEERRRRDLQYAHARLTRRTRRRRLTRDNLRVVACLLVVPASLTVFAGMAICLCAMSAAIGRDTVFWTQRSMYRIVGPFILAGGCLLALLTYVLYKWTRTGQHRLHGVQCSNSDINKQGEVFPSQNSQLDLELSNHWGQCRTGDSSLEYMPNNLIRAETPGREDVTSQQEGSDVTGSSETPYGSQSASSQRRLITENNVNGNHIEWRPIWKPRGGILHGNSLPLLKCDKDRSKIITYEMALLTDPETRSSTPCRSAILSYPNSNMGNMRITSEIRSNYTDEGHRRLSQSFTGGCYDNLSAEPLDGQSVVSSSRTPPAEQFGNYSRSRTLPEQLNMKQRAAPSTHIPYTVPRQLYTGLPPARREGAGVPPQGPQVIGKPNGDLNIKRYSPFLEHRQRQLQEKRVPRGTQEGKFIYPLPDSLVSESVNVSARPRSLSEMLDSVLGDALFDGLGEDVDSGESVQGPVDSNLQPMQSVTLGSVRPSASCPSVTDLASSCSSNTDLGKVGDNRRLSATAGAHVQEERDPLLERLMNSYSPHVGRERGILTSYSPRAGREIQPPYSPRADREILTPYPPHTSTTAPGGGHTDPARPLPSSIGTMGSRPTPPSYMETSLDDSSNSDISDKLSLTQLAQSQQQSQQPERQPEHQQSVTNQTQVHQRQNDLPKTSNISEYFIRKAGFYIGDDEDPPGSDQLGGCEVDTPTDPLQGSDTPTTQEGPQQVKGNQGGPVTKQTRVVTRQSRVFSSKVTAV